MRHASFFCVGVLLLGPLSPFGTEAHAQRRPQAKKRAAPAPKKPVIKLQETPPGGPEQPAPATGAAPQRGPTRIDFDDRLVQGQTNRAGAVYLYDRKELKTEPMVKKRESFRDSIIETVYDAEPGDRGAK